MCQIEYPWGSNYFQNSAQATFLSFSLVMYVLKSKKLNEEGGRVFNASAPSSCLGSSSSSFLGFSALGSAFFSYLGFYSFFS